MGTKHSWITLSVLALGLAMATFACTTKKHIPVSPVGPANTDTATFTPTFSASITQTPVWTLTWTSTSTDTLTPSSPTDTPTPTPTKTATDTSTCSPTPTQTNSPTSTATFTDSLTPSDTPTGTWATSTPTLTPINTGTPCWTATATLTGTFPPSPNYYIRGSVTYTGTGTSGGICVAGGEPAGYPLNELGGFQGVGSGGTYTLGSRYIPVLYVSAYYDLNGLNNVYPNYGFSYLYLPHVPGMRYTTQGSCSNPASPASYAVTISGSLGATVVGPNLSFDDTCSYWGIYGNATYNGARGTVGLCRMIHILTYSDAAYSVPLSAGSTVDQNGTLYYFVTNDGANQTGLTPLYIRVYFDADGSHTFTAGDPYVDLGLVTPTTDGLDFNITFDDTFIK